MMIQQINRLQNINTIWAGNAETMKLTSLFNETDKAWVDIYDNIKWLDQSRYFTWTSERDGWRHLYKVSRDGKEFRLITKGPFDVVSIQCIDEKGGFVYYIASPESNIDRYLYRSRLDGTGVAERITPAGDPGHHSYNISPNGSWAVHTFNNAVTPSVIEMVALPQHTSVKIFEENKTAREEFKTLGLQPKEFFRIPLAGVTLDGWMIRPPHFDPAKKYPVIVYFYEKYSDDLNVHYVPQPSRSTVNFTFYNSNGYIVFVPDITYRTGEPGRSAYDDIISGTMAFPSVKAATPPP